MSERADAADAVSTPAAQIDYHPLNISDDNDDIAENVNPKTSRPTEDIPSSDQPVVMEKRRSNEEFLPSSGSSLTALSSHYNDVN